jgi:penicillin-binding protein 1A
MKTAVKYLLGGFAALVLTGLIGAAVFVFMLTRDLPSHQTLATYEPPVTTRVYAGTGTLIAEYARERRLFVPIDSIPPLVKAAFLSAEDKNFYNHPGIDIFGILRAVVTNLQNSDRRPQGASTITQQVARNFLLTSDVNYTRKAREAILAMRIDNAFSKDKILELYLNQIFLGENSYGVAAAAINYFSKSLDELTPAQAAYLASLPKAPSNYNPIRRKAAATARRNWVLDQMAENGYITREVAASGKVEDLVTYYRPFGAVAADVDYFVEDVRRILYAKYGQKALYDGGLQVRTTLDPRLQDIAVRSLRKGLIAYDRRHGWRGPITKLEPKTDLVAGLKAVPNKSGISSWRTAVVTALGADKSTEIAFDDSSKGRIPVAELTWARKPVAVGDVIYVESLTAAQAADPAKPADGKAAPAPKPDEYGLRQVPAVNGGLVAIDPFTGHVLALAGGFSYGSSEYNRATQAMRQPGSTFKPFVYATALDNGYTPISKVLDSPFSVPQGPGLPWWTPGNYEAGEFLGPTTLRVGVELSRNVMTARLAYEIGMPKIAGTVERMGVYDKLPRFLSMSLGAGETTVLRITNGYAQFVNGGRKIEPTLIDRVQDRHGKTVFRFDTRDCTDCNQADWRGQEEPLLSENRPQVLDQRTAYQIVSILEGVVQRGTGTAVAAVGKPLAGKTGTSSDFRDVWFVGFSPDLAVGVFIGYDNPRSLGGGETGGRNSAPIFRDFMAEALADKPATPFRIPDGVVLVPINPRTGQVVAQGTAGSILEAFKPGTEPGAHIARYDDPEDRLEPVRTAAPQDTPAADSVNVDIGAGTGGLY